MYYCKGLPGCVPLHEQRNLRKGMVARCYMASVLFTMSYLIAILLRVSRVDGLCLLPVLLKSRRILSLSNVFTFQRIAVAKWCGGS